MASRARMERLHIINTEAARKTANKPLPKNTEHHSLNDFRVSARPVRRSSSPALPCSTTLSVMIAQILMKSAQRTERIPGQDSPLRNG